MLKKKRKRVTTFIKIGKYNFPTVFPIWNWYFSVKEQVVLFCLLLIGLVSRIVNAIYTPIWRDEAYLFFTARNSSLWELITQQHGNTVHPPLQYVFFYFWQMISVQPIWLRLPGLIASFFILYLTPILAIKIIKKNRTFPFIFLFLFSVSHTQISLDMVARPYPFVSLLVIASLILFFSMLEKVPRDTVILGCFVFTNSLAVLSDYSALWLFVCYGAMLFIVLLFKLISKEKFVYISTGFALSVFFSSFTIIGLISYWKKSINLEEYLKYKFDYPEKNTTIRNSIYIVIDKSIGTAYILNDNKIKIAEYNLNKNIYKDNMVHIGASMPPLSSLLIDSVEACELNSKKISSVNINTGCVLRSYTPAFFKNMKNNKDIPLVELGNMKILFNGSLSKWITSRGLTIKLRDKERLLIKLRYSGLYLDQRPGIDIYNKIPTSNWENTQRFSIPVNENGFDVNYYDGKIFPPTTLYSYKGVDYKLNLFYEDILFFSSFPSNKYGQKNIYFGLFLIAISLISLFQKWRRNKYDNACLFCLISFLIPALCSLLISVLYSPIFLGRNLFLSTFFYLIGMSILTDNIFKTLTNHSVAQRIFLVLFFIINVFILSLGLPYLHYTDPVYDTKGLIKLITKEEGSKKIILIENSFPFCPLIDYYNLAFYRDSDIKCIDNPSANYHGLIKARLIPIFLVYYGDMYEKESVNKLEQSAEMEFCKKIKFLDNKGENISVLKCN